MKMGLTIHYELQFQGTQEQLISKLTKVRSVH